MTINIERTIKKLIYFIFIYMMLINVCCDEFNIPTIVRYIPDLFLPIFIIFIISKINYLLRNKSTKKLLFIIILFLLHCIIGNILNAKSLFYFFWGFRNIFRFIILMLCSIIVFDDNDLKKVIKIIHKIFILNIIVCFIQYFLLGYWGDAIGGTFRLGDTGGNAGIIYLIIIENSINIVNYLNKKCSIKKVILYLFLSVLIAVFAELKVVYIFILLIIILALLLNKFTLKTICIVGSAVIAISLGYTILEKVDPETAKILNIVELMEYAGGESHGYSSEYDISRIRAFEQINDYFFMNNLKYNMFGYGLGNCDVSSIDIFNSYFARQYNDVLHYTWFSHAMLYLETGIIGYLLYILIYIYIIIYCFKRRKLDKDNYNFYNSLIIILISSIIMTWYNSILRNDISYFIYIIIILPFITKKDILKKEL